MESANMAALGQLDQSDMKIKVEEDLFRYLNSPVTASSTQKDHTYEAVSTPTLFPVALVASGIAKTCPVSIMLGGVAEMEESREESQNDQSVHSGFPEQIVYKEETPEISGGSDSDAGYSHDVPARSFTMNDASMVLEVYEEEENVLEQYQNKKVPSESGHVAGLVKCTDGGASVEVRKRGRPSVKKNIIKVDIEKMNSIHEGSSSTKLKKPKAARGRRKTTTQRTMNKKDLISNICRTKPTNNRLSKGKKAGGRDDQMDKTEKEKFLTLVGSKRAEKRQKTRNSVENNFTESSLDYSEDAISESKVTRNIESLEEKETQVLGRNIVFEDVTEVKVEKTEVKVETSMFEKTTNVFEASTVSGKALEKSQSIKVEAVKGNKKLAVAEDKDNPIQLVTKRGKKRIGIVKKAQVGKSSSKRQRQSDKDCIDGCSLEDSKGDTKNPMTKQRKQPGQKRILCEYCDERFSNCTALRTHWASQHGDQNPFKCNMCNKGFPTNREMRRHKYHEYNSRADRVEPLYACKYCSSIFKKRCNLRAHERKHTGEKPYVCEECGKAFSLNNTLKQHLESHVKEDQLGTFGCEICGKVFGLETRLKRHIAGSHHTETTHPCEICGNVFKSRANLYWHLKIHANDRSYPCPHCGAKFYKGSHLKIHLLHEKNRSRLSCPYCTFVSPCVGGLSAHLMVHPQHALTRGHVCPTCHLGFKNNRDLIRHSVLHLDKRDYPYFCVHCGEDKRFPRKDRLRDHMKKVHKEFNFIVADCTDSAETKKVGASVRTKMKTVKKLDALMTEEEKEAGVNGEAKAASIEDRNKEAEPLQEITVPLHFKQEITDVL